MKDKNRAYWKARRDQSNESDGDSHILGSEDNILNLSHRMNASLLA